MGEICLNLYGEQVKKEAGITLLELAKEYQSKEQYAIVLFCVLK